MSAIAGYLEQLERELRLKRAPRRRLLAEAADHLRESANEIAASGVDAVAAEEQAVARFGDAALVARRFAHAVVSTSARTALVWAATAGGGYAFAAFFFILVAPRWLRDFPQGAASMLALQVAAVALALSALRVLRYRTLLIDELRLRFVANGVLVATAVLTIAAAIELLLAFTRPAPAPWSDAASMISIFAVAALATLLATFVAVATAARASVLAALPRPHGDELSPAVAALVDDVAAAAPPLRPLAALVTSRPAVVVAATAALSFAAMTLIAVVDSDGSGFAGAAATGLFEAAAVVVAYLAFGRLLGLRAPRRQRAD